MRINSKIHFVELIFELEVHRASFKTHVPATHTMFNSNNGTAGEQIIGVYCWGSDFGAAIFCFSSTENNVYFPKVIRW